jgi:hypothetical protein
LTLVIIHSIALHRIVETPPGFPKSSAPESIMVAPHHNVKQHAKNPFRTAVATNGSRRCQVLCVAFALGVVLISMVSLWTVPVSHDLPPDATAAPRNSGGLRSQSKLAAKNEDQKGNVPKKQWEHDHENDDGQDEEEDSRVDPEDRVTPNKRIGETREKVKQEHEEIHAEVQGHIFGQNRTASQPKVADPEVEVHVTEARANKLGEEDDKAEPARVIAKKDPKNAANKQVHSVVHRDEEKPLVVPDEDASPSKKNHSAATE